MIHQLDSLMNRLWHLFCCDDEWSRAWQDYTVCTMWRKTVRLNSWSYCIQKTAKTNVILEFLGV